MNAFANLGTALATVGTFQRACRASGWGKDRPHYLLHISSALRQAGMEEPARGAFAYQWAADCGGTGPLEFAL
jgi:hypothetical protein